MSSSAPQSIESLIKLSPRVPVQWRTRAVGVSAAHGVAGRIAPSRHVYAMQARCANRSPMSPPSRRALRCCAFVRSRRFRRSRDRPSCHCRGGDARSPDRLPRDRSRDGLADRPRIADRHRLALNLARCRRQLRKGTGTPFSRVFSVAVGMYLAKVDGRSRERRLGTDAE